VNPLVPLLCAFHTRSVRFVLIGVAGANHYAPSGQAAFITQDHDLFFPLDPDNLVLAWEACATLADDADHHSSK
jgi:hypothetical protein